MKRKGFTLTEVLFVIVIAAVLIALIVPQGMRALANANFQADQSNIGSIEEAALVCWSEQRNWGLCDSANDLTKGQPVGQGTYIKTWPTSPCGGGGVYQAQFLQNPDRVEASNSVPCPDPALMP